MLHFELPTDRVEYLQLALPATGPRLVAHWGTQSSPFSVAAWDDPGKPNWQLTDGRLCLSPDGEWVSVYDKTAGEVRITRVGARKPPSRGGPASESHSNMRCVACAARLAAPTKTTRATRA